MTTTRLGPQGCHRASPVTRPAVQEHTSALPALPLAWPDAFYTAAEELPPVPADTVLLAAIAARVRRLSLNHG